MCGTVIATPLASLGWLSTKIEGVSSFLEMLLTSWPVQTDLDRADLPNITCGSSSITFLISVANVIVIGEYLAIPPLGSTSAVYWDRFTI